MDAWISSQPSKLQKRDYSEISKKRSKDFTKSFHNQRWQSFKETEPYYGKSHFLPEEKFSGGWTSSVKTRPWKHLRGCFFILKSLNSDNFRRRLQESIIALDSFKELWKLFRMQAGRRRQSKNSKSSSEHMPVKKNSQDEWLLRGPWPINRLPNGH